MTVARVLVGLHPAAIRERWGPDLENEILQAGPRSWPDALVGIARMWLHPEIWPARSHAERRLRLTAMAAGVTAACWFVAHLAQELDDPVSRGAGHSPVMSAGAGLMLAGLLLAAPVPRPAASAVAAVLHTAVRRLGPPSALGAVAVAAAHTGLNGGSPAPFRLVVLACWWAALATSAVQVCRLIAVLGDRVLVPAPARRLRAGAAVLAAGCATSAAGVVGCCLVVGADVPGALAGLTLTALVAALIPVLRPALG